MECQVSCNDGTLHEGDCAARRKPLDAVVVEVSSSLTPRTESSCCRLMIIVELHGARSREHPLPRELRIDASMCDYAQSSEHNAPPLKRRRGICEKAPLHYTSAEYALVSLWPEDVEEVLDKRPHAAFAGLVQPRSQPAPCHAMRAMPFQ